MLFAKFDENLHIQQLLSYKYNSKIVNVTIIMIFNRTNKTLIIELQKPIIYAVIKDY